MPRLENGLVFVNTAMKQAQLKKQCIIIFLLHIAGCGSGPRRTIRRDKLTLFSLHQLRRSKEWGQAWVRPIIYMSSPDYVTCGGGLWLGIRRSMRLSVVTLDGYAASHRAVATLKASGIYRVAYRCDPANTLNNVIEQDHRRIKHGFGRCLGSTDSRRRP